MFGTPLCDELRGYLDVKVPSAARKKGLLVHWKAWRRRWLVVRRYLVSSDPSLVNADDVAILGRRLEVKLTGDDSSNRISNVSAPCPVVVVEEWQEDALVCPTKSRSHPYAFGLFPQPGCEPVLFLSGRSAEESRRWLSSIRSLLVPPFRPHNIRLSSFSYSPGEDAEFPIQHISPLSSSPDTYQTRSAPSKSLHICFPPLPPLPSRCRLRRRSSLESLSSPCFIMDRRRSLSDSEITSSSSSHHHHHRRHKCQAVINEMNPERSKNVSLNEDFDHHIYAGIGDSGVCSSMSNDSRSCLSSSSSSCSSSSGVYAYAAASGFTSYLRENSSEVPADTSINIPSQPKIEESTLIGKVASSLVTAGIGLILSTPVPLDGVHEFPTLPGQNKTAAEYVEEKLSSLVCVPSTQNMDLDRRESIASGIYEEIQDDDLSAEISRDEELLTFDEQSEGSKNLTPPPLPPRSPSQCLILTTGRQRDLAWFLGVHRNSSSCPASDGEDEEPSRDSSPIDEQESVTLQKPKRKISEPSGSLPNYEENGNATIGYSRGRRKNLETFLGVMEFGTKSKEINKSGVSFLNKSLGALELSGIAKGEKDGTDKTMVWQSRGRTYTDSAGTKNSSYFNSVQESNRSNSSDALLMRVDNKLPGRSLEIIEPIDNDVGFKELDSSKNIKNEGRTSKIMELPQHNNELANESSPLIKENIPPRVSENAELNVSLLSIPGSTMKRSQSLSCSSLKSCQSNKTDGSERSGQSPKSPRFITKRLQWMKPNLMRLLSKEQNRQPEPPSLKDKTRQVIHRSLETLGWLSLATSQMEEQDSNTNLVVGGSSFYRSATCTGVEMQNERHNALRRGTVGICNDENRYSRSYESMTLDRRKNKKIPNVSIKSETWSSEMEGDISTPEKLLEESVICPYHKSQLKKSGRVISHTLEDIERLARQEMICEQFCNSKDTNEQDYIPMRPLQSYSDKEKFTSSPTAAMSQANKRVSIVPEEDHYISMEGVKANLSDNYEKVQQENDPLNPGMLENSISNFVNNDGDIYMSMEGRKMTQEEVAQR